MTHGSHRVAFAVLASSLGALAIAASGPAGPVDANVFVQLAKKSVPSVVNISTYTTVKSPYAQGDQNDLFRKFFEEFLRRHGGGGGRDLPPGEDGDEDEGDEPPMPDDKGKLPKAMSLGTGFIIDSSGLILTNNHVVADADEIKISFTEATDETPTDGEVVGRDTELDVALIKVKTKREMEPLPLGDSDALDVGEYVMAVGNPFGQGHSVTHGIISAKGRLAPDFPLANYLQTDAPINPGNSGGPLLNLKGEVIGINNAIDQRAQGIGFAIPISLVKKILPQLKTKGIVTRGYIGVLVNEMTPDIASNLGLSDKDKAIKSPFVTHAYPGEPAAKAGLKTYDVILKFGDKDIHTSADLVAAVTAVTVGDSVKMKIIRDGKEQELTIKVGQRPGTDKPKVEKAKPKKERKNVPNTGMTIEDLTPEIARELGLPEGKDKGVIVNSISYGGPADKAGIARGDLIVEVARKPIKDVDGFYAIVKDKKSYLLRVRRLDSRGSDSFSVVLLDLKE